MTTDNRSFSDNTSFPAVSTAALLFVAATELAAGTLTIEPAPCPACSASVSASSEGLGRVTMHGASGPVYEAAEEDMFEALEEKAKESLRSGEWGREMAKIRERAMLAADRPEGLPLPRSTRRTKTVEPLPDRLPEGHPLKAALADFERRYLLVDATDPRSLRWAKETLAGTDPQRLRTLRVVLTNGSVREAGQSLGTRVWFDARGALSRRFGLTTQPALVTLSEKAITVETPDLSGVNEESFSERRPDLGSAAVSDPRPEVRPENARRSSARRYGDVGAEGSFEGAGE